MRTASSAIWDCVEPVVQGMGYELVGVEFGGGPGDRRLRVYIDAADGITVDDCASVSRALSASLDVDDPIPERYALEISSPGIDRPLFRAADFARFAGETADVRLVAPVEGRRRFKGRLAGMEGGAVLLEMDGTVWRLPLDSVARARLVGRLRATDDRENVT